MPLFKMVNTVTLDSAVSYKTWTTGGFNTKSASHTNRPPTVLLPKKLWSKQLCKSVNVCEMLLSAAGLVLNEHQHVPFCHVCNHNAN